MSGVSWYDVLGVEPDASPEAIRTAWRAATDKFGPGESGPQFRMFTEAAEVLLDPARRAAYDAEIGVRQPVAVGATAETATAATPAAPPASTGSGPRAEPMGTTVVAQAVASDLAVTHRVAQAVAGGRSARRRRSSRGSRSTAARSLPAWVPYAVVAVLSVLIVAALLVGATFAYNNHEASQTATAGDEASAAAERALPVILSYDYRHLKADRDQAVRFMTPRYRREYTTTFDKLITSTDSDPGPAVQAKAVVKASVEDVGVVSAESERVRVIVFLNQTTTKGSGSPQLALNRLTATMAKSGNAWLVENIVSY